MWLPDGTRIVFESQRYGNFEIMAMDPSGTNQVRLTNNRTFDGTPTISPDEPRSRGVRATTSG